MYDYLSSFKEPAHEYYPNVMWFWNDRMVKEEIVEQIKAFKKANIYDFFIHPMWGMELDYLSDEFFDLIKLSVKTAKENGMRFWIYDEYCWPSGTAGGKLLKEQPEANGKVLLTKKITLFASQPLDVVIDGAFVSATALHMNYTVRKEDLTSKVTLTETDKGTRVFCDLGGCSTVTIYLSYVGESMGLCASAMWSSFSDYQGGWLDTNDKTAVKAFLDSTYEKYKEAIGEEFGKTVVGVFNDEANNLSVFDNDYYRIRDGQMPVFCNPWTRDFLHAFEADNHYDFTPCAYALAVDQIDDEVLRIRYDYWKTMSHLFAHNYVRQISEWCRSNQLKLTGHLSGEDSVRWHAYQMGDSYLALSEFDIPGVDNLFAAKLVDNPDFPVTDKFAATAAKLHNKPRVFSEAFSGSGWETKMQEIKRVLQRISVCGINLPQYMGAYYSLNEGRRRYNYCWPPSHCYNSPLAEYYAEVNTIMSRINAVSAHSTLASKVFVVLPLITLQMDRTYQPIIDKGWQNTSVALMLHHTEYDIASERALYDAEIKDGKFTISGFAYEQVIIPCMYYSDEKNLQFLKKLITEGGNVLFIENHVIKAADSGKIYDFSSDINGRNVTAMKLSDLPDQLLENITDCRDLILHTEEANIFVSHRIAGEDDLFFVDNDNNKDLTVECTIKNEKDVYILHTETGNISKAMVQRKDGCTLFQLPLAPYTELIILSTDKNPDAEPADTPAAIAFDRDIPLTCGWAFQTERGNWAILLTKMLPESKSLLATLDTGDTQNFLQRAEADFANTAPFAHFEFPGGYDMKVGDRYVAMAEFHIKDLPSALELIVETENDARIFINDREITDFEKIRLWGIRERTADILPFVKTGKNKLVFTARIPSWHGPHSMPMSFLRGDFRLAENTTLIKEDGSILPDIWTKQGYPNYSGKGTYTTTFTLNEAKHVVLEIPTSDVVCVTVNGQILGELLWNPYKIDISSAVKCGENTLELTFTSTYKSLAQAEDYELYSQGHLKYCGFAPPAESGLTGVPRLWVAEE